MITTGDGDTTPSTVVVPAAETKYPNAQPFDAAAGAIPSAEQKGRADELKLQANALFAANKFARAADLYGAALEYDPTSAVLWSNRAFCNLKLENYGLAIVEATKAIEADPRYVKSYYRRASAHSLLLHYRDALKDFDTVLKLNPKDREVKQKRDECDRKVFQAGFAKAIAGERAKPASTLCDMKAVEVESSYDGPHYDGERITIEFVNQLIERFKEQKRLHRRYVYRILLEIIKLLQSLPTLVDIDIPEGKEFTVCGDVHGQFYDVCNIFKLNGMPSEENPYLFNGDFVDRGSFSFEVIVTFYALKLLYPKHFHMTRGNHESATMNQIYGFQGEVLAKCDVMAYNLFTESFNYLPLAMCLNKKVLVVHGGLFSEDGVTLDQIRRIDRNQQPPESGLMCEILWSDPQPHNGRAPSKRGVGLSFGPDVTSRFLAHNNLELVVRSHEVKEEGYQVEAGGQCITIFSAPNYCDSMGNKGAFIRFGSDLKPKFTKFAAVPHPTIQPMAYAQAMFRT